MCYLNDIFLHQVHGSGGYDSDFTDDDDDGQGGSSESALKR